MVHLNSNRKTDGHFSGGYLAVGVLSEEEFVKKLNLFDELKLRLSYGTVGNQGGIDRYDGVQLYNYSQNSGALIGSSKIS